MKQEKYENILKHISPSMKMMLDYIKRYLDEGKASVFVGAGFSRNAKMPETTEMKDWNMLGVDFYQRLYGCTPSSSDAMFLSPIHLASEVEASFGRNELDNLIIQSLPDDFIIPSKLHKKLLGLNWHDVFTTNYDTLLERGCLDSDRPYNIVTNKETLLYSSSPRIVKLHGSFPNIRPFIITEEDYRTYPDRFPEFVNTVRQALIENLFCLIGFSGDDPNFKNWYGWLRDVMGQQIAPVYLITYDTHLHDAKRKLFAGQKIEILNLGELPFVDNIQDGFEFLFQYLECQENSTVWDGKIKTSLLSVVDKDSLLKITNEMASVRRKYPGWLALPSRYDLSFDDVAKDIVGFNLSKVQGVDDADKIRFLYELCWRQNISNTPIGIDWYVDMLARMPLISESYHEELLQMVIELKLTLLRYYRKHGLLEEFQSLVSELEALHGAFKEPQIRFLFYERCLCAASYLDYSKLGMLLNRWDVAFTDYLGVLWKSSMLIEMNRKNEAINLLNESLRQLDMAILVHRMNDNYLKTCQSVMSYLLWLYSEHSGRYNNKKNNSFDFYEPMNYYEKKLREVKGSAVKTSSHNFNVGSLTTTWSLGHSGFLEEYLYSYRFYSFRENCGLPLGMLHMTLDKDKQTYILTHLINYNIHYAIAIIVRSNTKDYIRRCVTRKSLTGVAREEANAIFEKYSGVIRSLNINQEEALRTRIINILVPILSRVASKASGDVVMSLLNTQYVIYQHFPLYFIREDVKLLYNCLAPEEKKEAQIKALQLPVAQAGYHNYDFPQIYDDCEKLITSDLMVSMVTEGLASSSPEVQTNAYLRLRLLSHAVLTENQKVVLRNALISWRGQTKDVSFLRDSYVSVPFFEREDIENKTLLLAEDLSQLKNLDIADIHSSEVFHKFRDLLAHFTLFSNLLNFENFGQIFEKFGLLVANNEELLQKDDFEEFFGGFRGEMSELLRKMEGLIYKSDLTLVPIDTIVQLTDVVKKLASWNYRHVALLILLCRYDNRLKESEIKKEIDERIAVYESHSDAIQALLFLSKRNSKFQQIIQGVVRYCMYSTSQIVFDWLDCLECLVRDNVMTKDTQAHVLRMLSYVHGNLDNYSDVDVKNDIMVNAGRLAGTAARFWGSSPETNKWKTMLTTDKNVFNEARYAFG